MTEKKFLRDLVATIKGNGLGRFTRIGDFISVKEGENLEIIIDGNTSTVESGDELELPFVFKELVIRNKSEYDQKIILAVGFGKFRRPQIKGTVTAVAGIIGADGRTYSDDRINESVNLAITNANPFTYNRAQLINTVSVPTLSDSYNGYFGIDLVGRRLYACPQGKYKHWDIDTGEFLGEVLFTNPDSITANLGQSTLASSCVFNGFLWTAGGTGGQFRVSKFKLDGTGAIVLQYSSSALTASGFLLPDHDNNKLYYIPKVISPKLYEVTESALVEVADLGISSTNRVALYQGVIYLYDGGGNDYFEFDIATQTLTDTTADATAGRLPANAAISSDVSGAYLPNNVYVQQDVSDDTIKTFQLNQADFKGWGFVSVGECQPLQIFNRDAISKISANVTLTQNSDATVTIEGELIKAILELYAARVGGAVPVDYLDYIYGIKGAGLNTYSGDESFARVGIVDNFTINSPDKLQLYFSKRLLA